MNGIHMDRHIIVELHSLCDLVYIFDRESETISNKGKPSKLLEPQTHDQLDAVDFNTSCRLMRKDRQNCNLITNYLNSSTPGVY